MRITVFLQGDAWVRGRDSGKTTFKVNSPIVFPILNEQNCTETLSITRKTYNMFNLLVLSLILYKCLHFVKIFAVFEPNLVPRVFLVVARELRKTLVKYNEIYKILGDLTHAQ
jgi:hypothetical protein